MTAEKDVHSSSYGYSSNFSQHFSTANNKRFFDPQIPIPDTEEQSVKQWDPQMPIDALEEKPSGVHILCCRDEKDSNKKEYTAYLSSHKSDDLSDQRAINDIESKICTDVQNPAQHGGTNQNKRSYDDLFAIIKIRFLLKMPDYESETDGRFENHIQEKHDENASDASTGIATVEKILRKRKKKKYISVGQRPLVKLCMFLALVSMIPSSQGNEVGLHLEINPKTTVINDEIVISCKIPSGVYCDHRSWLRGESTDDETWEVLAINETVMNLESTRDRVFLSHDGNRTVYNLQMKLSQDDLSSWWRCECNFMEVTKQLIKIDESLIVKPKSSKQYFTLENNRIEGIITMENVYPCPTDCRMTFEKINIDNIYINSSSLTSRDVSNATCRGSKILPPGSCEGTVHSLCFIELEVVLNFTERISNCKTSADWKGVTLSVVIAGLILVLVLFVVLKYCLRNSSYFSHRVREPQYTTTRSEPC